MADSMIMLEGENVKVGRIHWTEAHPHLLKEWHLVKNGGTAPIDSKFHDKVWWCLSYDDPETGKSFDFSWQATIASRIRGRGCPFLSGKAVWPGYNDLATKLPDLAAQWHPTKNGGLTPEMITCYSNKKVWWLLPYDDPETGKHFDFVWQATIANRSQGSACPFLADCAAWPGYNDLTTKCPDLVVQWHPKNNGELTPEMVTYCSNKKVWWHLPYDDPETGKHFDFEWQATIDNRTQGTGCPFLVGKAVWPGYNDLATKRPDLTTQWHPKKNGELTPEKVTCHSDKKVWWYLPYNDPETGKHFDFEWQARISGCVHGNGCPFLSGKAVWSGYNDLATKRPDLAAQWHPKKNGKLTPEKVTCYSSKKVWWHLLYDDPDTGKHFEFAWQAKISCRVRGDGCPFLSGKAVWPGYNDLTTKSPNLAAQWHPKKNGELTPEKVTCYSNKKVWWLLPYDDPKTGKHFDFAWKASINDRVKGCGCPFLSGSAVWSGYNDLATKRPDLAAQWHPTKNGKLTPELLSCGSVEKVWWCLPFVDPDTGKHFEFVWLASINDRVQGSNCPFLSGHTVWPGFNDLETCSNMIAAEWHQNKNQKKDPNHVYMYEMVPKRWWECSKCGHEWRASVRRRTVDGVTCPNCRRNKKRYE